MPRVLDDVVQEADDLHALVVAGVAQDVDDRLGVWGSPLPAVVLTPS